MNRLPRFATTAVVSAGVGLAVLGLGGGTAQAEYWWHWCPGQQPPSGSADRVIDWDWTVCHDYYYQSDGNGYRPADIIDEAGHVYSAAPVARPPYCPPWNVIVGPSACGGL